MNENELKTVNDFGEHPNTLICADDLRQEARKHIQYLEEEFCEKMFDCAHCVGIEDKINWIKMFFNLEETKNE